MSNDTIDFEELGASLDAGLEAAQSAPVPGELPIGRYAAEISGVGFRTIEPTDERPHKVTIVTLALSVISADPTSDDIDPSDLEGEVQTEEFWLSADPERQARDFQMFKRRLLDNVKLSSVGGAELIRELRNLEGRTLSIVRKNDKTGKYVNTYINGFAKNAD